MDGLALLLLALFSIKHPQPSKLSKPPAVSITALAGKWAPDIEAAAHKTHVPPVLLASVLHVENQGFINACAERVSDAGAIGPMQLMPNTAWNYLRINPWNPKENILGGAKYLAYLLHVFHNNERLALIAYNAGPTLVAQGGRPESAVLYAQKVLRYAHAV